MIRHFVEFQGKPYGSTRNEIRVTLNKQRVFVLNAKAFEALKNPSYVKLYFDEPRGLIAMRRVEGGHPNAFPVKSPKRARHKLVHAAAFCAHFKFDVDHTVMFQTPKMEGDLLTLDMNKTATVSRGAS
jgi:hypothetical protein